MVLRNLVRNHEGRAGVEPGQYDIHVAETEEEALELVEQGMHTEATTILISNHQSRNNQLRSKVKSLDTACITIAFSAIRVPADERPFTDLGFNGDPTEQIGLLVGFMLRFHSTTSTALELEGEYSWIVAVK